MIVAAAALIAGFGIFALVMVISQQDAAAYARAPVCSRPAETANDCYSVVTGHIKTVDFVPGLGGNGKISGTYTIVISSNEEQWTANVNHAELLTGVSPGEEAQIRIWRNTVTELKVGNVSAKTLTYPSAPPGGFWLLVGVGVVVVAIVTVALASLKGPTKHWRPVTSG